MAEYPTALGASSVDKITLLGQDLADDVMGKVGFGELAFWLATQRRPTDGETRVFEAVLAALADHGFTPTAIVTRLTYLSAPDSIQGALAAGLLGGGSRFLGVTEDCGRFLHEVLESVELPMHEVGWDALALETVTGQRKAGKFIPGLGHHVHKRATRARQDCSRSPARRTSTVRTSNFSPRSAACTHRCWERRCLSTAQVCAAPLWPTWGSPWSCCAASPCWPAPRV
jgi:citrate synthase